MWYKVTCAFLNTLWHVMKRTEVQGQLLMKWTEQVLVFLLLSTALQCSKMARSSGSTPGVYVCRYFSCRIASLLGVRTPVEIILQKTHLERTGDDAWAGSGVSAAGSAPFASRVLDGDCCDNLFMLPCGSMGRVLLSSMTKFKITSRCNSSADLYLK